LRSGLLAPITLGDSTGFFNATMAQSTARNGQAQAAPPAR